MGLGKMLSIFTILACFCFILLVLFSVIRGMDFWLTSDQQGERLMRRGKFGEAAKHYRDPLRAGIALYRSGEFEAAATLFGRLKTPEAQFNRGNALVMLGKYHDAVHAYDTALMGQPAWREAQANRAIAQLRAEQLRMQGGDMTSGMLAADEIIFTSGEKHGDSGQDETTEGNEMLSDQALQAMWLRRIQTRPADFLRAKFAYQVKPAKR